MNKSSIFFSINLTFIALFIFILISFGFLYKGSQKREELFNQKRAFDVTRSIKHELTREGQLSQEFQEYLSFMDYSLVEKSSKILKNQAKNILTKKERRGNKVITFELQGKTYLHIRNANGGILLQDNYKTDNFRILMIFMFVAILVAFSLLYLNTLRKLKPLNQLKKSIKNIGEEDFEILLATDKKDEISQLANEFDKSAKKLKALKESRNVFIRNIMHELKTPITKGQFLVQLPKSEQNQESMQKVFYRLESLINEFASIEELISSKWQIKLKEYSLLDLVDNASDLLMVDEDSLVEDFEDVKLKVDFKLFSIAMKNLMDNAIKYSRDKKVTIKTEQNAILFLNQGEKLSRPLEEYFEAFSKSEKISQNQSFGLGLYIVKHILDAHKFTLEYEYKEGVNFFRVTTVS